MLKMLFQVALGFKHFKIAQLAQLAEHCDDNAGVLGSNPRLCIKPLLGAFIIQQFIASKPTQSNR